MRAAPCRRSTLTRSMFEPASIKDCWSSYASHRTVDEDLVTTSCPISYKGRASTFYRQNNTGLPSLKEGVHPKTTKASCKRIWQDALKQAIQLKRALSVAPELHLRSLLSVPKCLPPLRNREPLRAEGVCSHRQASHLQHPWLPRLGFDTQMVEFRAFSTPTKRNSGDGNRIQRCPIG